MMLEAGEVSLEAVLWEPANPTGVALLCHPYPLHGGSMNTRVIYCAARAAEEAGLSALRFNFRGVGASTGFYDRGIGERKDAAILLDWLGKRYPSLPLALIGFSFGSWVGLRVACHDPRVRVLVGLGLPLTAYDFEFLIDSSKPSLFLMGSRDEFCPRELMEPLARRLPPSSEVRWIEGADHLFTLHVDQVQSMIRDFMHAQLQGDHK